MLCKQCLCLCGRGALIPLARDASNTKSQKWNELLFDFYPDQYARDQGYVYEDDTESTAYQLGQYRKSRYESGFCAQKNAYFVRFFPSAGIFQGEKAFSEREITLKFHLIHGAGRVKSIILNGKKIGFERIRRDSRAFPFGWVASPDADTLIVRFLLKTDAEYLAEFLL